MATRKVPPGLAPVEERIQEEVPFDIWYVPHFPIYRIGGQLDKDPEVHPWLQGLYDDIKSEGALRNPVIIWNHHKHRGTKQPKWLIRAGSNRLWCADQIGWKSVPAIVTTHLLEGLPPSVRGTRVAPRDMERYFKDPGVLWANEHGIGLLQAAKPEVTYADAKVRDLKATGKHGGRRKLINPLFED